MARKTGIDIDKLRKSQLISNELYKDGGNVSDEIRRKKQKREEAKQAIIKKINEDVTSIKQTPARPPKNQLDPIPPKPKANPAIVQPTNIKTPTNIKVIKANTTENEQKIKETQERISYTLQMDAISDDQIAAYKRRKARKQSFDINDKFTELTPKITYIYVATTIVLLILVSASLYFLNSINS